MCTTVKTLTQDVQNRPTEFQTEKHNVTLQW